MCLSQSCTVVLLHVVCTNGVSVVVIFKALVDYDRQTITSSHSPLYSHSLVPLRLLPFRLLMVKLCHFTYSTKNSKAMNTVLVTTPIASLNSSACRNCTFTKWNSVLVKPYFSSILLSIAMNFLYYLIIHCCQSFTTISPLCTSPKHVVITTLPIENILVTFINQWASSSCCGYKLHCESVGYDMHPTILLLYTCTLSSISTYLSQTFSWVGEMA